MSDIYLIRQNGTSVPVQSILCKDEDKELQRILEANLNLLPGDQIDPENPRNWLLIRREMPVPDPSTGSARWSIDFFVADQDAIPTFIECKRHDDTRARREVVGQMLEYVANGHYYWDAAQLQKFAESASTATGRSLEAALSSVQGPGGLTTSDYFRKLEENLRSGHVRMVFVLEESSYELRSIVEFLNRQMEDSEVLLVEIRQYQVGDQRLAIPTLFGFTERARAIKKASPSSITGGNRRAWDEESFVADAATKTSVAALDAIRMLLAVAIKRSWNIRWGTGKANGSLSLRIPTIARRSLLSIYSNGQLILNLGWLNENTIEEDARNRLADFATTSFGTVLPKDWQQKFVPVDANQWAPKMQSMTDFLDSLEYPKSG